jgi:hypothetical protein
MSFAPIAIADGVVFAAITLIVAIKGFIDPRSLSAGLRERAGNKP